MRRVEKYRLTEFMRLKLSLPASLAEIAHKEFWTIEKPTRKDYRDYRTLVRNAAILSHRKPRLYFGLFIYYWFGISW